MHVGVQRTERLSQLKQNTDVRYTTDVLAVVLARESTRDTQEIVWMHVTVRVEMQKQSTEKQKMLCQAELYPASDQFS